VAQPHFPAEQVAPAGELQGTLHPPQLLLSVCVFTHVVPHRFGVGDAQLIPQLAPLHVPEPVPAVGPGHAFPHMPQLLLSVW
jgi:hypothetical protein